MSGYRAVVIGTSAGGTQALSQILPCLPADYGLGVIVVQHLHPHQANYLAIHYNSLCALPVKEADEKEKVRPGHIYTAPPNYHLLLESNETFSLSIDAKVQYSRPAIDVLFESAARVYQNTLVAVLLTGANQDGAEGCRVVAEAAGLVIIQEPETAVASIMPQAGLASVPMAHCLPLSQIGPFLAQLETLSATGEV